METRKRLKSIASKWSACGLSLLFCGLFQSSLCAQFHPPLLLSDGLAPMDGGQIHLDTSCSTCSPQQVSICAKSADQLLFSGTLMQFGTMVSVLDSSNQLGAPSLTQGSAAHYLISLDEQIVGGPRFVSVIESVAVGFGDPEQVSEGPEDQHSSVITILDSGHRVVSWIRSDAGIDTVMMKYGANSPIEIGTGSMSQLCSVGGESVLICWLEGSLLRIRIADSGSVSAPMELYDLLSIPTFLKLHAEAQGHLKIITLLGDQLLLLEGSLVTGINTQQVIRDRAIGVSHLSFVSLYSGRYCLSWIQDGLIHRYSFQPGGAVTDEILTGITGQPQEVEVAIDAAGNEHFLVIADGDAWYLHDTPAPEAELLIQSSDDGIADHSITFQSESSGLISSHYWDFGDGESSTSSGGEHTYLEPGTYTISLTVTGPGGTDTAVFAAPVVVAPPESSMALADISVFGGQPVFHPVLGTHSSYLQGFQIALEFDGLVLEMSEISLSGTQAESLAPEFVISQINMNGEDSTMYIAVIFDTLPPFDGRMMDPGSNQTLCTLDYTVNFGFPMGTSTELRFMDSVGDPPINTIYAIEGGFSESPYLIHGTVSISEAPQFLFVRGDVNYNQSVNIADAIFLLDYLFTNGEASVCPDAADSNDDGQLNIGDAIYLLNFLFSSGETIPYPYPGYGIDPSADDLGACLP
ncbi:MAG: PKD domain-containing protein [Planctomycetota bacterium]|nr:PKD domain-containing protein [Planctomycetota bacterium]